MNRIIKSILTLEIRLEHDVVSARQRARHIASLLGFEVQDQVRIATAVSEIARNAYQYAGGGLVNFLLEDDPPAMTISVQDAGPGIRDLPAVLEGRYSSATGMGMGIIGVRRLMDDFRIDSTPGAGTTARFTRRLPRNAAVTNDAVARIVDQLSRRNPQNPLQELQQQNQELLRTLQELHHRQEELRKLNRELEDTNRGVVALYAELDEKADFLRRASEMKSRFLSNMSHEFRTPLNSISGLTRLLLDRTDGEISPEQEKQLTMIRKAAEDLMELVNDLLDLAKVEAGKVTVQPNEFKVESLFSALRGMLRPLLASNQRVSLIFEDPVDMPVLDTDEGKVSQILRNFISNALKFTESGEVRVKAEVGKYNTVVFSVADTGIGIAPADQERIFEEFTQLDSPRQRIAKGTGLGLPLVKRLAALLGGQVRLKSQLGVGSTFAVSLPLTYRGPREVALVPEVSAKIDPDRRPVLVVEDNRETLFIYEKYLKGSGFQAIPARTLAKASQALAQFRPAAMILDILLEGENTWEFLADLKQAEGTRDIPVFVVTLVENEAKARALGADAFCNKPVQRDWLFEQLHRHSFSSACPSNILVIDDDEASRYLLKNTLVETGYRVIEAATGHEGMNLARTERPMAIFLDLDLPDCPGFDLLQTLRREQITEKIPIIINTAQVLEDEARRRLMAAGATAILSKQDAARETRAFEVQDALHQAGTIEKGK